MKKTIVCYGDSNTYGYNPATGGRFNESERWPCILSQLLGEDYLIIEEGLSGRTTAFTDPLYEGLNGTEYITPCLLSHEPIDLLIIMLGTNDTKIRFNATAHNITNGLRKLVLKAQSTDCWKNGKRSILIIAPAPIEKGVEQACCAYEMGPECSEKSYALSTLYEPLAQTLNCYFLDAHPFTHVHPSDYMHLDQKSHIALASAIAEAILSYDL